MTRMRTFRRSWAGALTGIPPQDTRFFALSGERQPPRAFLQDSETCPQPPWECGACLITLAVLKLSIACLHIFSSLGCFQLTWPPPFRVIMVLMMQCRGAGAQ